jgi:glycosyltransferase involved in cell wall biosynthesis
VKRVLMLAYYFPPSKAAGTFRTLRFVRDLPAYGWEASVLTVRPATYLRTELDAALLHKVPDRTRVHRTAAPPLHRWYKRAIESAKKWKDRGAAPAGGMGPAAAASSPRGSGPVPAAGSGIDVRSPLDLLYMLCRTPDIDAGWYLPALARGLAVVMRRRPDVLYATGGPWTTFLVARDLARLARLPLVLDYRDPWTSNPAVVRSGNAFEALALRYERAVVRRATRIVANTDVLREGLLEAHGAGLGSKTVVIHNSFDPDDYSGPEPAREDIFTLSYVGAMYDAHSPEPLLKAAATLAAERPDLRSRFRIRLTGSGAPRIAARVRALGIEDIVVVGEPVSHAEAVRLQRAAHGLLLFLTVPSDHSTFVPSKLFEYVAARRPILAVTRGGALERLLRGRGLTPWVYRPEDELGIAQGLLNLIERHERGDLPSLPEEVVNGFSGAAAAGDLAAVLESARTGGDLPPLDCEPVASPEREVVEAR